MSPRIRGRDLAAALAPALLLALQLAWLHEPFDRSKAGTVGADQVGYVARAFDAHGPLEVRLRPTVLYLPGTLAVYEPYLNHPVPAFLAFYGAYASLGRDAAALRSLSLLLLAGGLLGVWLCSREALGSTGGAVAVALFATSPLLIQYGATVDNIAFASGLVPLAVAAWFRHLQRGGRGALLCHQLLAFGLAVTTWYGWFLAPALWLDLLLVRPPPARRLRKAVLAGLPFLLAAVVHAGLWTWALGGPTEVLAHLAGLADVVMGKDPGFQAHAARGFPFLQAVPRYLLAVFGPLLLLAAAAGCVLLVRDLVKRRRDVGLRMLVVLLVAGLLPGIVFWSRSTTHQFLTLVSGPPMVLLAARGVLAAAGSLRAHLPARLSGGLAAAGLAAVVAAASLVQGLRLRESFRPNAAPEVGHMLSRVLGPRDVVVMPTRDYQGGMRFASQPQLIPLADTREDWRTTCAALAPGRDHIAGMHFMASEGFIQDMRGREAARWMADLPVKPGSRRILEAAGRRWFLVDLDVDRALGPTEGR